MGEGWGGVGMGGKGGALLVMVIEDEDAVSWTRKRRN